MRFSVVGVKGGVGKSTLSVALAKLFARSGRRVLLVDRDLIGWSSHLLGLHGGSLIGAAAGREEPFHLTVEEGKGSVTVVRVNPDPPEFGRYFSRASEGRVEELYVGLLRGSEVQVVDNPSNVFFDDPLVRVELRAYLSALPGDRWYRVYVSDPSERGVEATLKYAEALEASAPGGEAGAFVVNMVPPLPEEYAQASSRVGELKFPVRAVVPFDERLYTYGSFWDFGEFPEQVARLGRVLLDMPTTATVE